MVSAVLCLALGVSACGDSDDDGGNSASAGGDSESATTSSGGDREYISRLVAELEAEFDDGDPSGFCAVLSQRGRKEVLAVGQAVGAKGSSCEQAMKAYFARDVRPGISPYRISSVAVNGRQAVVATSRGGFGESGPSTLKVSAVGDGWLIDNPFSSAEEPSEKRQQ